ncbi:30S ribosomal protein S6 [Candidatus Margulisiibacteriota bacterium]
MNSYELMMIFDPNLGEEKIAAMLSKVEAKIKSLKGEVEKTDKWGTRPLSSVMSRARKLKQGYYVVIYFKSETSAPGPLQAYLKVTENIVRYSVLKSVGMPPQEIKGSPTEGKDEIEAVNVGEIKGAGDIGGQS